MDKNTGRFINGYQIFIFKENINLDISVLLNLILNNVLTIILIGNFVGNFRIVADPKNPNLEVIST